jgi:hypothetical protein
LSRTNIVTKCSKGRLNVFNIYFKRQKHLKTKNILFGQLDEFHLRKKNARYSSYFFLIMRFYFNKNFSILI